MYQYAATQQTSTEKLPAIFWKFQIKEQALRVNENKVTGEKTFNEGYFVIEASQRSGKDKKKFVWSIFADLWPGLQHLDSEKRTFTFFEYCLLLTIFQSVSVDFGSQQ